MDPLKLRNASESVGNLNSVGPLTHAPQPSIPAEEAAKKIEQARTVLDSAFNATGRAQWDVLVAVDSLLRQIKKDLGYPKAGLGVEAVRADAAEREPGR
jgi:hypothetical protein